MNIISLYKGRGFTPRQKTADELCGPCPWCGGKDRFTLFINQTHDGLGRYWCRQCGKVGDAIQFLRELDGLGYLEARNALGLPETPDHRGQTIRRERPSQPEFTPREATPPGQVWQERSAKLVTWAQEQLRQAPEIQAWLTQQRGITGATAVTARLGWVPEDFYRSREKFGLSVELKENGKPRRVWIPKGLCIPVFQPDGRILRVKFRVSDSGDARPKYIPLPQTEKCTAPLVIENVPDLPWQVVESELDALLLAQEAGFLVNVIGMGSAVFRPDAATWSKLQTASRVLVSLDYDEAGSKSAIRWWETYLPKGIYKLWPVPEGKDPTDAWREGWNLADWTRAGLEA